MTIDAIAAVGANASAFAPGALSGPSVVIEGARGESAASASRVDFMDVIGAGLSRADNSLQHADAQLRALSAGHDIPIHDVMIAMEQARLDLTLVVEVRNRLVESYQEMMRMQL